MSQIGIISMHYQSTLTIVFSFTSDSLRTFILKSNLEENYLTIMFMAARWLLKRAALLTHVSPTVRLFSFALKSGSP